MRLENKIKDIYESSKTKLGEYLVDTSSRILFYVPTIGVWEKFVAGMENEEVLKSRGMAVLVNAVGVGKLHTLCRKYLAKLTKTDENSSPRRKSVVDFASGLIVGLSSYSAVLYLADVSLQEGLTAMPFAMAFTCLSGNIYGRFNDWYRQKFNFPPILNK
jgi:hypothetical protein